MKEQQKIISFILMSVVLHGLLVVWLVNVETVALVSQQTGSILTVELVRNKKEPEVKQDKAVELKSVSENAYYVNIQATADVNVITTRQSDVVVKNRTKINPESRQFKKQHKPEEIKSERITRVNEINEEVDKVDIVQEKSLINYDQIALLIKNDLTKYFYYPVIAQRRQWQGQVIVEFTIFSSGLIDQIKIRESSGYAVLDDAALAAVKKINQSEQFSLALNGQQISQLLPVTYKLLN